MKTVQIRVNPKFKPEGDAQKKAFEDAKKAEKVSGPKTLPYTTAPGPDGDPVGHVLATPLGENAFMVEVERLLLEQDGER